MWLAPPSTYVMRSSGALCRIFVDIGVRSVLEGSMRFGAVSIHESVEQWASVTVGREGS